MDSTVEVFGDTNLIFHQETKDDDIRQLLQTLTKRARIISFANLGLGAFISTCFVVYPLFTAERGLPYGMWIPGVDNLESPQYEVLFVIQAILTFPGCCMYIPFTSFFATCTLFGLIMMKKVQHQLKNLKGNECLNAKLNSIIKEHSRVITYVHELNDLVTYICMEEFLSFGLMLCALLFLANIVKFIDFWCEQMLKLSVSFRSNNSPKL